MNTCQSSVPILHDCTKHIASRSWACEI